MANQSQKYRPYLTIQQIKYFIQLAEADNRAETEHLRLKSLRELGLFVAKNDLGLVRPALTVTGQKTIEDKLGLGLGQGADVATSREEAYNLWCMDPQLCTDQQVKQARLYRYENDLMSPEEEAQYESEL